MSFTDLGSDIHSYLIDHLYHSDKILFWKMYSLNKYYHGITNNYIILNRIESPQIPEIDRYNRYCQLSIICLITFIFCSILIIISGYLMSTSTNVYLCWKCGMNLSVIFTCFSAIASVIFFFYSRRETYVQLNERNKVINNYNIKKIDV
jgi:hypothetical protein